MIYKSSDKKHEMMIFHQSCISHSQKMKKKLKDLLCYFNCLYVFLQSMVLGDGRQAELWVCFNPAYCLDRVSRVVDEVTVMHFLFCSIVSSWAGHSLAHMEVFPKARF